MFTSQLYDFPPMRADWGGAGSIKMFTFGEINPVSGSYVYCILFIKCFDYVKLHLM